MIDCESLKNKAREELLLYRDYRKDIDHYRNKIDRLQAKIERTTKPLDPDWVAVQRNDAGPEELLCIIADMQVEYGRKQIQAERICMLIELRISERTSGVEQRILRDHYLFNQQLKDLTDECYSYVQIKRLHRRALEHYGEKMIPNDTFFCDTMVVSNSIDK